MALSNQSNIPLCTEKTLLPDNATEFELHTEEVMRGKYCHIDPAIIADLQDSEKCPLEFLPYLAFSERVTAWDDALPETQKRQLIARAREVNELKGTDKGLQDALDALGVSIEIIHWHEMQPQGQPGTMNLKVKVSENFNPNGESMIDARMTALIEQTIQTHKRFSIHHIISLGIDFASQFKLSATAQFGAILVLGEVQI